MNNDQGPLDLVIRRAQATFATMTSYREGWVEAWVMWSWRDRARAGSGERKS